jgi:hypothetical protein
MEVTVGRTDLVFWLSVRTGSRRGRILSIECADPGYIRCMYVNKRPKNVQEELGRRTVIPSRFNKSGNCGSVGGAVGSGNIHQRDEILDWAAVLVDIDGNSTDVISRPSWTE